MNEQNNGVRRGSFICGWLVSVYELCILQCKLRSEKNNKGAKKVINKGLIIMWSTSCITDKLSAKGIDRVEAVTTWRLLTRTADRCPLLFSYAAAGGK